MTLGWSFIERTIMNKKVLDYLNGKEETNYTHLDKILSFYVRKEFKNLLSKNGATKIEFFSTVNKRGNAVQVCFNYYNMSAILEFKEEGYEYCKYKPGCSAEEMENKIIRGQYKDDFSVKSFVEEFIKLLDDDSELVKSETVYVKIRKKKKMYSTIAFLTLVIPFLAISVLALYVFMTDAVIQVGYWAFLVIIVPLIICFIFDTKSKRMR